jgi:HAUS augmin-like complex subunit 3
MWYEIDTSRKRGRDWKLCSLTCVCILRQLLHEVQHGLRQTRGRTAELTSRYLAPLVQELGKLQANKILRGDYDLKIARQDYFVSKQDQVLYLSHE